MQHPPAGVRRAPLGVRGAPSGPRTDLSGADTAAMAHNLYVKVVGANDPDSKSRLITLEILKYVSSRIAMFRRMGIVVQVKKVRPVDLQNAKLLAAMKGRGITRLPALTTLNNVYLGYKEISDVYERNIREFNAMKGREEKAVVGAAPDADDDQYDLQAFYKDEMSFERADEDAQETGIGESDDMMDSYRTMMERREQSESGRRKPGRPAAAAGAPAGQGRSAPPPAGAARARPDNIAAPPPARRPAPSDPDDAEIMETIDRLARDIDEGTRTRAFSASGGDSLDDDGGSDIQDELMERAYYSNTVASDLM